MIDKNNKISQGYFWFNEPAYEIKNKMLYISTSPETDFWQKTHYDFEKDNGHCLLIKVKDDFSISVKTSFIPKNQYDQCGLIVRIDSENWIKTFTEYEAENFSRLGSVVTNSGYSDWATIDINTKIDTMWYRIQSSKNDFLIEFSEDGISWKQLRVTHLHNKFNELSVGIFACSPKDGTFDAVFDNYILDKSGW
jgi:hypothetical protein